MSNPIFRSLFHYYVALKLSSAAVGPLGAPWVYDSPPPIVRRYSSVNQPYWDPLEVLQVGTRRAILTRPVSSSSPQASDHFLPN
jgi:hypothetical protein